jgi:hypothetical protein
MPTRWSLVRWSQDGKDLVYMAPDGYLMSVELSAAGSAFQTGKAQRLFKPSAAPFGSWDISADGNRGTELTGLLKG